MKKKKEEKPVVDVQEVIAHPAVRKRRFFDFRYILVLLVISFTVLSVLAKFNPYFPFDLVITQTIQHINLPFFSNFMSFISFLGNVTTGIVIVGCLVIFTFIVGRKKDALFIFISSGGAPVIGMIMKILVGRPRPPQELLTHFPGYLADNSFPSGHVLFFMGLYSFLLFLFYTQLKNIALRTVSMLICLTLLVLIGISRIYLGAHWFSDTLGSYLVGSIWLYAMAHAYKKITFGKKKQTGI